MTSPRTSRPNGTTDRTTQPRAGRLLPAALLALALLAAAWAALGNNLVRPALANSDDSPPSPSASQANQRNYGLPTPSAPRTTRQDTDLVDFTYRLKEGDDLALLALDWGVDGEAIACVTRSGLEPLSELRPGQVIMIPNPRYRCHTVQGGESVEQIARDYGVEVAILLAEPWNALEQADEMLKPGRRLLILDGARPDLDSLRQSRLITATTALQEAVATPVQAQPAPAMPAAWPYGDGKFIWPVQGGVVSQGFHPRHRAIDIAAPIGTPVYAADNGVVLTASYSRDGYGGRVVIDHQIDYVTLYAHLSQALVSEGDIVQKGQIIGTIGSTGNSTGPHIHFELRDFGYLIDPRPLLSSEQSPANSQQ